MPRYKGELVSEEDSPDDPKLHVFEYSSSDPSAKRTNYRKEIIAMESCIFINRWNLASKHSKTDDDEGSGQDEEEGEEEDDTQKQEHHHPHPPPLGPIKQGKEFDGYVIKCPNGSYDYAIKLWDSGRVAPMDDWYPKKDEEIPGVVIDRKGDYLVIACGSNIAYATKKSFMHAGVDPDGLSLPFGRLKVALTKADMRPIEVPAAAWEARPTQIRPKPK